MGVPAGVGGLAGGGWEGRTAEPVDGRASGMAGGGMHQCSTSLVGHEDMSINTSACKRLWPSTVLVSRRRSSGTGASTACAASGSSRRRATRWVLAVRLLSSA